MPDHQAPTAAARDHAHGEIAVGDNAPGKRPRQSALRVYERGMACDRDPDQDGCSRGPGREYLLPSLSTVALTAALNFHAAISDAKLTTATASKPSWSALATLLFAAGEGPLAAAAVQGALSALAAAKEATLLRGAVSRVVGAGEKMLHKHVDRFAGRAGPNGRTEFVNAVREGIALAVNEIVVVTSAELTDAQAEYLIDGYMSPDVHSISAYATRLDTLLQGFDRNRIATLGTEAPIDGPPTHASWSARVLTNEVRLSWVVYHGRRRLAILLRTGWGDQFDQWVDDKFRDAALAAYRERSGRAPDEVNLDDHTQRAGCAWADQLMLDGLTGCVAFEGGEE